MIKDEDYSKVLDSGLSLDHYFLLCQLRDGFELMQNRRIQGFKKLLEKRGYIKDEKVTEKGLQLIHTFDRNEKVEVTKGVLRRKVIMETGEWLSSLHTKCIEKIEQLTGKKQVTQKLKGKNYSFMPNPKDFENAMTRCIIAYKLKDLQKIETTLLRYIENCYDSKSWFPILRYYIIKEDFSNLVTDMENPVEKDSGEYQSNQKFV